MTDLVHHQCPRCKEIFVDKAVIVERANSIQHMPNPFICPICRDAKVIKVTVTYKKNKK